MNSSRIIPITPIWDRYLRLRNRSQQARLAEARRLIEYPEELATEFAVSVAHFDSYVNIQDGFYPSKRPNHAFAKELKSTKDLILRLKEQNRIVHTDAPNRLTKHDVGTAVTAVPASSLACDYVDRELLVQRTTSPAQWEDGSRNVGGLRLDLLLADSADRTPVVGELKLPGDMDPFFALIQALACAAHLSTRPQYERMRQHLKHGDFPQLTAAPRLDVWVLFVDPPGYQPGQPQKGRYMADLSRAAETLAPRFLAQDAIGGSVRRIAGVRMKLDRSGTVASEVHWAWGRSGESTNSGARGLDLGAG